MSKSQFFSLCAFFGFGVSLVVHLSTFFDVNLSYSIFGISILHIGIFLVWIPVVLVSQARGLPSPRLFGSFSCVPAWGQGILILAFLYALINFASFQAKVPSKSPYEFNGKYMIDREGFHREISKQEL